jgi:hypothetical protein
MAFRTMANHRILMLNFNIVQEKIVQFKPGIVPTPQPNTGPGKVVLIDLPKDQTCCQQSLKCLKSVRHSLLLCPHLPFSPKCPET